MRRIRLKRLGIAVFVFIALAYVFFFAGFWSLLCSQAR